MTFLILALIASAPDTLWSSVTSGGVYSSVAIEDINGDGITDVISGVNFWDSEPTLWALSGADGSTIWNSDQCKGIYQDESLMAVPDMNDDSYSDVVLSTPGGYDPPGRCVLLVSGVDGQIIWSWSAYQNMPGGTGWGYCCAMMEDQTGDGLPEFLAGFGTTGGPDTGTAVCIDGLGGDTVWTVSTADATMDVMAVPDITGDGIEEVCLGIGGNSYTDDTVRMLDGATGETVWLREGGGDVMCLALADRSETYPFIIDCTFDGEIRCHTLGGDCVWAVPSTGMLLDVEGGPDLTGDGIGEIALAADDGGTVCLDGSSGSLIWGYPTGSNTWSVAWAESVLVGDEVTPCIVGGSINGRRITLVDALTGQLIWDESFSERVYNVSVIPSLNGLPSMTIMAGLQDQTSLPDHAWAFASSLETGIGYLYDVIASFAPVIQNPCHGCVVVPSSLEGCWKVTVFDLAGRRVCAGQVSVEEGMVTGTIATGCYLVRMSKGSTVVSEIVTVLP